jgi:peroxiredoxin
MSESPRHIHPGDRAPDFTLPAAHAVGTVSLAEYRARSPVLLALFRGLYCPFCRRSIVQLGETSRRLATLGVATVGVIATAAERSRLYFRFRPTPIPFGADPELSTHRAYGLPNSPVTPEIMAAIETAARQRTHELGVEAKPGEAIKVFSGLDGFEPLATDEAEHQRHQSQLEGQFLIDPQGVVRWCNIEGAKGVESLGRLPTDEELLHAARAL